MKSFAILEKIENQMEQFTQAEKKVAAYIMNHAELVPNMTAKEVSKHAGASEASVVRFCKTIGVSSFKAFKIALVRELTRSDGNISDFSVIKTQDAPYDLLQKVLYHNKQAATAQITHRQDKSGAIHYFWRNCQQIGTYRNLCTRQGVEIVAFGQIVANPVGYIERHDKHRETIRN